MKVGSLVECVDEDFGDNIDNIIYPTKGSVYTVRDIDTSGDTVIRLEEIRNAVRRYAEGMYEAAFDIDAFREIQPPMDLTELLEETKVLELVNQA